MAYPMSPTASVLLERTNCRSRKRAATDSPKGALVRPALADPGYFRRYHMLSDLNDLLDDLAYKIRRLKRDMARGYKRSAADRYALMDLEEEYQITLSSLKKMARNKI